MRFYISILFLLWTLTSYTQTSQNLNEVSSFKSKINAEYADRKTSPLLPEDFKNFKGLDFYPISNEYKVEAKLVRALNERSFVMKTTGITTPYYIKYGTLHFNLHGRAFQLNVYQNVALMKKKGYENYLFLPFSDTSCGKESYIGGRYIDLQIPENNTVILDFNQAYNPYCAYNYKYSCPLVPLENDLDIPILAGVKTF